MNRGVHGVMIAALATLVAAGPAAAQEPPGAPPLATFTIDLAASTPNAPVVPVTGIATTTVNVTVACEQGSVHPQADPITIDYMADSTRADVATFTLDKLTSFLEFTPDGCLQGMEQNDTVSVGVFVTQDARAQDEVTVELTATLEDGTTEAISWTHVVGTYFRHQVRLDGSIHDAAPGTTLQIPGTIENFGNADVVFAFALLPDDARRVDVTMPPPVTVPAFDEGTFEITVEVPPAEGLVNRRDTIQFQVEGVAAHDATMRADPEQHQFVVHTKGGGAESPGPALPALVVLVVAVVLGRRRTVSTI